SPTQYFVPMYLAHSSSKEETSLPRIYHPERSTSIALSSYSFACKEYCLPKLFGIIIISCSPIIISFYVIQIFNIFNVNKWSYKSLINHHDWILCDNSSCF